MVLVPLNFFYLYGDVFMTIKGYKIYSALMAFEQWEFFNVSHLLWPVLTLYNSHLRGPVTHSCWRAFIIRAVTICLTTYVWPDRGSNPDLPHARRKLYYYTTAAVVNYYIIYIVEYYWFGIHIMHGYLKKNQWTRTCLFGPGQSIVEFFPTPRGKFLMYWKIKHLITIL